MQEGSFVAEWSRHPIYEALGLTIEERAPGNIVVRLPAARPEQRGGGGTSALNGGMIAYMFDSALGAATASALCQRAGDVLRVRIATISLDISYLRAAHGDSFEARATVIQLGRTIAFVQGTFHDAEGTICATAHGTWRIFTRPDT